MLPPLGPPFPFITKVGIFKRQIKDYYSKIVKALSLYFIKIFIDLLDSHVNTQFKKGVIFIFKA